LSKEAVDKSVRNYFAGILEGDTIGKTVDIAGSSSSNIGNWGVARIVGNISGIYRS
jgi:hypothetical protein